MSSWRENTKADRAADANCQRRGVGKREEVLEKPQESRGARLTTLDNQNGGTKKKKQSLATDPERCATGDSMRHGKRGEVDQRIAAVCNLNIWRENRSHAGGGAWVCQLKCLGTWQGILWLQNGPPKIILLDRKRQPRRKKPCKKSLGIFL